ncbi:hypothetical protein [Clavibacter sp. CFBP 8614]|uniref:hypothetical protein n=1 Tax=unclassified Clavibacter TaxID=2626594 RepID=UPI0040435573
MNKVRGDVTRLVRGVETHPWAHLEAGYWRVQVEDHPVLGYVLRVRAALGDPFTYEIHGECMENENLYRLGARYYDATTGGSLSTTRPARRTTRTRTQQEIPSTPSTPPGSAKLTGRKPARSV